MQVITQHEAKEYSAKKPFAADAAYLLSKVERSEIIGFV